MFTGRAMGNLILHKLDIIRIALNQHGSGSDRKIAILDKNKEQSFLKSLLKSFLSGSFCGCRTST